MSARPGFERLVTDWLYADATAPGSERVLAAALDRVASLGQERRRPTLRLPHMIPYAMAVLAAAVVVVAMLAGFDLASRPEAPGGQGPAGPTSSPVKSYHDGGYRTRLSSGSVEFSLDVALGWDDFGMPNPNHIAKSIVGPQGAEAKLFWTAFTPTAAAEADECAYLRSKQLPLEVNRPSPPVSPAMADLAAAVSTVPGTELVAGPTEATVGGLPAEYIEFIVRDDVGCDPGFFFTYPIVWGGPLWPETVPGDTIRVWIVDLGRARFFIEGATHEAAGPELDLELHQMVDSIQFE